MHIVEQWNKLTKEYEIVVLEKTCNKFQESSSFIFGCIIAFLIPHITIMDWSATFIENGLISFYTKFQEAKYELVKLGRLIRRTSVILTPFINDYIFNLLFDS